MQVGSGLGDFRQNQFGSVWVELGNVNKKLLNFLLLALSLIYQKIEQNSAKFQNQPSNSEPLFGEQNEVEIWTQHALKPL